MSHSLIDIIKMTQASNKAFLDWKTSSLDHRIKILEAVIERYIQKKLEIISKESQDQHLSLDFTEKSNFNVGLELLNDFKKQLQNVSEKSISPNGAMSIILSWNLSNRLFIEKAIAAVLAGNTVIVKFSSITLSLIELWKEILKDLPENVVQFVQSSDAECKKILVTHPGIKAVVVTGTLETCADVLKQQSVLAEKQFKKNQLNSGSKNSCIALDAPNDKLVDEVLETFLVGQGQLVWNSSRLFILEKHQVQWVEAISEKFKKIESVPLVKKYSGLGYDKLKSMALEAHAKLLTSYGGGPLMTYDMSNCSELQQDELRLPIFLMSTVKYPFDIPKYANVSYYGHSANIFSQSANTEKIIQQLDVGRVSVNKWSIFNTLYIKAVKQSAHGIQDHQIFGDFYSNVKNVSY